MTNGGADSVAPAVYLPSLLELTLFVSDVDKSAEFYRALGLKLFDAAEPGHPHMVGGGIGHNAGFQLFPAGSTPVTRVQLGLYVADLAIVTPELDRLNISYELPMTRRLTTKDPDGNRVHLTEVAKSELPA
jgi:catechol 2,3-dioxygenase-like lactoylglutathione lyase family enzyme